MNPFSLNGFDTLIGAGTSITGGVLVLGTDHTVRIDGTFDGDSILETKAPDLADAGVLTKLIKRNVGKSSTLFVGGTVTVQGAVNVNNVTVTGFLICDELIVHGQLSIKADAKIVASVIRYRRLHIEPGAVVKAHMEHLDHLDSDATETLRIVDSESVNPEETK